VPCSISDPNASRRATPRAIVAGRMLATVRLAEMAVFEDPAARLSSSRIKANRAHIVRSGVVRYVPITYTTCRRFDTVTRGARVD